MRHCSLAIPSVFGSSIAPPINATYPSPEGQLRIKGAIPAKGLGVAEPIAPRQVAAGGRRLRVLLGVAAIGAFLVALPAAALACETESACIGSGNVVDTADNTCRSGTNFNVIVNTICSASPAPLASPQAYARLKAMQNALLSILVNNPNNLPTPETELEFNQIQNELDAMALQAMQNPYTSGYLANPGAYRLGMYVSPNSGAPIDASAGGGGYVMHGSGYGASDSAGLLAPGTTTPSFRDVDGNGGFNASYDASRLLPTNQSLLFSGDFNYAHDDGSFGALAGPASAGSFSTDTYTFGGSVLYRNKTAYLGGTAQYSFGRGNETQTVDGSTGSFNTSGYSVDAKLGNVFVLLNTTDPPGAATLPTKAPPKPTGGYIVGVDASGHIGYSDSWVDGFTDSSGFVFGTGQTREGDIGTRVRLFAAIPSSDLLWIPYVGGTVDQEFGFSSTLNIPNQAALPGGDLISLTQAQTFWGTQAGLDVMGASGWTVGVKGFYTASADTNIAGGGVTVKVPLNYTPKAAWAPRY